VFRTYTCGDELGDYIRDVWIREWRRHYQRRTGRPTNYEPGPLWDGKETPGGRRKSPVWPRIADLARSNNLDSDVFVRAFFHDRSYSRPAPNMLLSPDAMQRYYLYLGNRDETAEQNLRLQVTAFEHAYYRASLSYGPGKETVERVLRDPRVAMTSLFRYAIACREDIPEHVGLWFTSAVKQYLENSTTYDQVWGDCVPEAIRTAGPAHPIRR
jgi:hypothetical protein